MPYYNVALGLAALGLLIGFLNFYLSFIRPCFYFLKHKSNDGYRLVSGFPIIGTALVIASLVFGFGSIPVCILNLVTIVIDTCGPHWFIFAIWKDKDFWRER